MNAPTQSLRMTARDLFRGAALKEALVDSLRKLSPRAQVRNPVMFVVYVGAILTTLLFVQALFGQGEASHGFILHVTVWLWFTVLFANFAESAAEGRAKAQAATLRGARREVMAKKLAESRRSQNWTKVPGSTLRRGDVVLVEPTSVGVAKLAPKLKLGRLSLGSFRIPGSFFLCEMRLDMVSSRGRYRHEQNPMAKMFPNDPYLVGGFAPLQTECDAHDLVIKGEIPHALNGTFYRNGPNPQFAPRRQHHWFAGDGMVHAFSIHDGRVSYRNRWARTIKWKAEHAAGKALFAAFNPMESDPSVQKMVTDGIANTNIVWHARKLLALEEGHAPFEMNPDTLDSIGAWTFDGKLVGPMTAHPKIDPETGEMVFFGYNAAGLISEDMSFHVVDKDGKLTRSETFRAPYAAMVHDFMVTRDHVIFPIMPLTGSMERAMSGAPVYAWEPEKGTRIGIMPRNGSVADMRWFNGEPGYVFHPMNAHTDGDIVTCDVCEFEQAPLFPSPDGTPGDPAKSVPRLTRWTFDLSRNSDDYKSERLNDLTCEFPRLDERRTGLSYRYGYFACDTNPEFDVGAFNGIGRIDHQTGKMDIYDVGAACATNEPIFVPRSDDAAEGDGYLLANVYDDNRKASQLVILDAQNLSSGPLATAYLDHRVPFGFHGNWKPA